MERYIRGEERWTDNNERHYGWEVAFKTLIAARLSLFDPTNPLLRTKREICVENLAKAFAADAPNEEIWESENRKSDEILLRVWMIYPVWLLQCNEFLDEELQRKFLNWIWNRKGGIYYVTNIPPADVRSLEDKGFAQWLSGVENLSGFSLFPEIMAKGVAAHLLHEIERLIMGDIKLPSAHTITGRYAESWVGGNARKNDSILRILRVLVRCYM